MQKLASSILLFGSIIAWCMSCSGGSFKPETMPEPNTADEVEKKDGHQLEQKKKARKCTLGIPDCIKTNVPDDMQYLVLLQLILGLVKSEYVNDLDDEEITEKAIAGILSSLDPHSCYLNEKALSSLKNQTDGEFGGLGIEIMMDDGFVRIISPVDDTPAHRAGIKPGDLIIYINDECINGISAEEALEKLRGKPGTSVKLKIKRGDGIPFNVKIERAIIKIESVKTEILDNIGYVRISTFDKNTTRNIKKFIAENKSKKLLGLVLDIRNNPGGLLDEAVSVSNIFLDGGKIVSTRGRTAENSNDFFATNGDLTNGLPLVILINSGTASAPEILAGALRDNNRATIVGSRSFGKGSVQKIIPLSDKTALKLTVAKHFTPSGECIQANGISPDIEADSALLKKSENVFIVREEILNNALDADKKAKNKKITDEINLKSIEALNNPKTSDEHSDDLDFLYRKLPLREKVEKDYQLNKAFDIIKAFEKFKSLGGGKK
ncbi:MAG: S41 family peptidase [Holosporaceae bacterium]|jgi:carboxyl-terminal processing protease|nr:S41 family peptidase [Holosporaceae bacterium]